MIPKAYYGLFYSFLSLVAASPVALQERQEGTTPAMGIKRQTITSGTSNPWVVFGSHLTFDQDADITEEHLVGIAKAAHREMSGSSADMVKAPAVMTALKVGNEVFLSSSMKGGGGVYIYKGQEPAITKKPNSNDDVVETGYGAFTEVLEKHAPEVKDALDAVRKKSRELGFGKEQSKTEAQLKGSGSQQQPSRTSDGRGSQNTKQRSPRAGQPSKAKEPRPKDYGENTYQHKNDANCGEIMASLRYRMVHTGKENGLRNKKNPQPTVVSTIQTRNGLQVHEPCAKDQTVTDEKCAFGWGCGAFVGSDGMNFHVVDADTDTDSNFPKFVAHEVDLPDPTGNKNSNSQPGSSTQGNKDSNTKPGSSTQGNKDSNSQPGSSTQGNKNSNSQPGSSTQGNKDSNSQPGSSTQGNKNSNSQPGSSTQGNKNSNTKPGSSTKSPPKKTSGKGRGH